LPEKIEKFLKHNQFPLSIKCQVADDVRLIRTGGLRRAVFSGGSRETTGRDAQNTAVNTTDITVFCQSDSSRKREAKQ